MTDFRTSGLLFDSDGVLVDSHEAAAIAWNEWATKWAPSFDFHRDIVHGQRMGDSVAQLVSSDVLDEAVAALVTGEMTTTESVTAMPGARGLLASLPSGCWVVVTSALRELARARLGAAQLRDPERLVAADDVTHGKPHPEPYLAGAAALGLEPADCTVFEDAPAGIAAALAAGVGTIVGIGEAAVGAGASIVVPDLRSVRFTGGVLTVDDAVRLDGDRRAV
jgi:sugar-phosphatase